MEQFTGRQIKDLKVLAKFVQVYCRARHGKDDAKAVIDLGALLGKDVKLCGECAGLVAYAVERRRKCPLEPKPSCKHCPVHCYSKEYRAKIREVMAFSGKRLILRGRLDLLWHYFF